MKFSVFPLVFLVFALSACGAANQSIEIESGAVVDNDLSTVNGNIRVGENATVNGDLNNVNGAIYVGAGSSVGSVSTVNGEVNLGENSVADSIETVNGQLNLGDGARVNGEATAVNGGVSSGQRVVVAGNLSIVNGKMSLEPDSRVEGRVENVNGALALNGAYARSLGTVSGSVEILAGSTIEGELKVAEPRLFHSQDEIPRIVIGENSAVGGPLIFEREVELLIHESAQVGEVRGAEPRSFSGSETD